MQSELPANHLYDDLPRYIASSSHLITPNQRRDFEISLYKQSTQWFDTHPSPAQRVAAVRRFDAKGILHERQPVSALFQNFEQLCKAVTQAFYRTHLGDELDRHTLVATETRARELDAESDQLHTMVRVLATIYSANRPPLVDVRHCRRPENAKAALAELKHIRDEYKTQAPAWRQALETWDEAREKLELASAVLTLLQDAKMPLTKEQLPDGYASAAEAGNTREESEKQIRESEAMLASYDQLTSQRIALALYLSQAPSVAQRLTRPLDVKHAQELLTRLSQLSRQHAAWHEIIQQGSTLSMCDYAHKTFGGNMLLAGELRSISDTLQSKLAAFRKAIDSVLGAEVDPLHQSPGPVEANQPDRDTYALDERSLKAAESDPEALMPDMRPIKRYANARFDHLAELLTMVEQVETALNLPPLVDATSEPSRQVRSRD